MARIGLRNFRYGILTEAQDGTPSYNGAHTPAKAISCNVSITNNDAKLYADDVLAESDTGFQSGTVTIGIDDEDNGTMANLLGHTLDAGGEMIRNGDDTAPYVGFGRVIVKMVGGVRKYKVEFLYKVKFSEPSNDEETKGESLEFGTTELEGTIATLANGKWSCTKTFDTQTDAIAYLNGLLDGTYVEGSVTVTVKAQDGSDGFTAQYVNVNGQNQTYSVAGDGDEHELTVKAGTIFTAKADMGSGESIDTTNGDTADVTGNDGSFDYYYFVANRNLKVFTVIS